MAEAEIVEVVDIAYSRQVGACRSGNQNQEEEEQGIVGRSRKRQGEEEPPGAEAEVVEGLESGSFGESHVVGCYLRCGPGGKTSLQIRGALTTVMSQSFIVAVSKKFIGVKLLYYG